MEQEGIAIIGMGCRFPGALDNAEDFWKFLLAGGDAVVEIPADRWNIARFYDREPGLPGKSMAKRGGFIEAIDQFDPQFFGISPREAPYIDPQQRLLLETAWEALEDAGVVLQPRGGTDIGVFAGISHTDYQQIQGGAADRGRISQHSPTGHAHSIAANRISYCLNLTGPSIAMDTACSSALTAVHVAVDHLRAGRCAMALAGGVTVMITPDGFIGFSQAGMLSPDGRCRAFDADANGFVRGEGAGMVLLKPLSRAVADGDKIYAVIRATSANQDGHTNGIMLPGEEAQARLVRDACREAGIDPLAVGYVEAHGTGTAVGDPIEAHALSGALCAGRPESAPLLIGSVKTNLGHLETAAGIAGLMKAALVVQRGQIPPNLHFENPSPHIDFAARRLRVPVQAEPYPQKNGGPRLAAVNSFGFGGANAHAIVAEPPPRAAADVLPAPDRAWPVVLSARSEESLRFAAGRLAAWLEAKTAANGTPSLLADLAYTLGARRNHHAYRLTGTASDAPSLTAALRTFAETGENPLLKTSFTPLAERAPRLGFVMSGQGPQWWGMGRQLMRTEPVFRRAMEECAAAIDRHANFSLLEELAKDENDTRLGETEVGQPAIFAMQVALAALWRSWGVCPDLITGHSVGEIAAAHVAGILTLEQAAEIITYRAQVMQGCARETGAMLAVGLAEPEVEELIARHDPELSIAAFNGPRSLTIAGLRSSLERVAAELESREIFHRFVRVAHPFHHAMMQPAADALAARLADLRPADGEVPFFSTVTGALCPGADCTADYWARGIRQPVQFVSAVGAMADAGADVWLEISAHPALAISLQECFAAAGRKAPVISSLRREREQDSAMEAVTDLHRAGVAVDFAAITPSRRLLTLPSYPWNKARWWHESPDMRESRLSAGGRGLLETRLSRAIPTWVTYLDERHMAYLRDHRVDNRIVFPAAGFIEMALEAGAQFFEGRPFVLEEFEIRKPLIIPDNSEAVALELSYDPRERSLSIQSRPDHSANWSVHAVGSLRAERVESAFEAARWTDPADELDPVDVGENYEHKRSRGLPYGPEFRAARRMFARAGRSAGEVSLSEKAAARADEYALHPVILDGSLHVFSAGARTVEARGVKLKLPVRFSRILFLRPPGAAALARTEVLRCNDEMTEGRIEIFDREGLPCVLVDGFRAVALSSARRAGSSTGEGRDLVYHVDWEREPVGGETPAAWPPVPLRELHAASTEALEAILSLRGQDRLETVMQEEDNVAASQIAAALRRMGVAAGEVFSAESLGVVPAMRGIFRCFTGKLTARGMLERAGDDGWRARPGLDAAADGAGDKLRDFLLRYPGHVQEISLCAATCGELPAILRGEKDAVQVLFAGAGTDWLEQFYGDGLFSSHWMAAIAAAVARAAAQLPEGRALRILEVGAGTGGLAAHILPLLERGTHRYLFTDASTAFFPAAQQKLAAYPEVEYKVFDLDRDAEAQGLFPETFDFIVGTNVLHAAADLRACLGQLHRLLAPGGTLAFMDVASPRLWTETVFGVTSGWWNFTDHELRSEHPLLPRARWEELLREVGFAETASLPGLRVPGGEEGQMGVMARKSFAPPAVPVSANEPGVDGTWMIFADAQGLGDALAARLRASGARCLIVRRGEAFAATEDEITLRADRDEDWRQIAARWKSGEASDRVVFLWSLGHEEAGALSEATNELLHLSHALDALPPGTGARIDVVTRGAQSVGRDTAPVWPVQGACLGLFRVMLAEHPNLSFRGIDLPAADKADAGEMLWSELLRADAEREVALRGEARYRQRIARGLENPQLPWGADQPLRLESRERGVIDSLRFVPFAMPRCGPGEVLIRVQAAGLNFRDVLKALGLYPAETADAHMYGDEVGGEIIAVGEGVTHVKPGDKVFGLAVFGLATHTLARGADVLPLPPGLTYEEAATMPVVFMTAWHALKNVARLRAGDKVLVHAGAGGVGMASIQIAKYFGAEVIASAGSPAKRALLTTLGVEQVIDSRRGDFAERVMELTGGRGVDVVVNALAGEAIPMGLSCLAEFGRFIEIGKRDIYQNSKLPMWHLRKNASFHVVAMDAVFAGDEALTRELLAEIAGLVAEGKLGPLPYRSFPANRAEAAFRLVAAGRHTGKVLLNLATPLVPAAGEPLRTPFAVDPEATYLVTGGFGGFGKVVARWLADRGARHLVLTGRSGAAAPGAEEFIAGLSAAGTEVTAIAADVGEEEGVDAIFRAVGGSGRPLKGIFHLAMVIDDALLDSLTPERMRTVLAPKARGAWLLHERSLECPLDAFVMFSSASSVFGNPAQGNYAAANAFLDALARHRRALGRPALAVNWGVLGGEGYVARNEKVAEYLSRQGTESLAPSEVTALLETFLDSAATQMLALRVDWGKWRQSFRGLQDNPLLERVFAAGLETEETPGKTSDWRGRIEAAAQGDREAVVVQALQEIIGSVLRVNPESLRPDQPLTDLGLDSLMGVEIENLIESSIGVTLPPASLMRARTIGQIAALLNEHLGGAKAAATSAAVPAMEVEELSAEEIDFEELADEDLERLVGGDPKETDKVRGGVVAG